MLELRPYQREAIDAIHKYWSDNGGNPLVVIPTGGGKSLVIAQFCKEILENYPSMRIGILTHVRELVQQNMQELLKVWPGAPVGIFSAGLGRRDMHQKILFMSIQSVYRRAKLLGGFDVILIDEAHMTPRNSETMYRRFLDDCMSIQEDMRLVGLTATPYRLDSGRLDTGEDRLFDSIVYEVNVRDMIEAGFLSGLISKATLTQIDTTGLHRRMGEFVQAEMDARARIPTVVESAVKEIVAAGQDRAGWLAFCCSVDHALEVRNEIRRHGVSCETVTGDTLKSDRDRIIGDFKRGRIRCLTSVAVLTTGFNAPHVDLIAFLRPTLSPGLYVQMTGRGFRLADGKTNCLVLDFAGNVSRHGPVDDVRPPRYRKKGEKSNEDDDEDEDEKETVKICPSCRTYNRIDATHCECGYEWPEKPTPPKHEARAADDAPILTTEKVAPKITPIWHVGYRSHKKNETAIPVMMVSYLDEKQATYRDFICFEHTGPAFNKACHWWIKMGGSTPYPVTTEEAVKRAERELKTVAGIEVRKNGKYHDIVSIAFAKGVERLTPEQRAKMVDKCKLLSKMTIANGCTREEADTAMSKVTEIQRRYGIRSSEIGLVDIAEAI